MKKIIITLLLVAAVGGFGGWYLFRQPLGRAEHGEVLQAEAIFPTRTPAGVQATVAHVGPHQAAGSVGNRRESRASGRSFT